MQLQKVGHVISLYVTTGDCKTPLNKNEFDVDPKGILLDKHYDKDIDRSILITSLDSYKLVESHDIVIQHSSLGENILIDYNPYDLAIGSRLKMGSAILEISQPCTLCNHLSAIDKKVPKLLKNDRGVFAKVIEAGSIKKGDDIYLLG